jgi:hypothetical protein
MRQARFTRIAVRFAIVAMLALFGGMPTLAADDVDALSAQVVELYGQGKYQEARQSPRKHLRSPNVRSARSIQTH